MSITIEEAIKALDGSEYGSEGSPELFAKMKAAGLVAVFGYSDDNMEFRGAINDEIGCYGGGAAYLTADGLLTNECDDDGCPYFDCLKAKASVIRANWNTDGFSWTYTASFKVQRFTVREDGEDYCRGVVFALRDLP